MQMLSHHPHSCRYYVKQIAFFFNGQLVTEALREWEFGIGLGWQQGKVIFGVHTVHQRNQSTSMRILDLRCGEICRTERQYTFVLAALHFFLKSLDSQILYTLSPTCILNLKMQTTGLD